LVDNLETYRPVDWKVERFRATGLHRDGEFPVPGAGSAVVAERTCTGPVWRCVVNIAALIRIIVKVHEPPAISTRRGRIIDELLRVIVVYGPVIVVIEQQI